MVEIKEIYKPTAHLIINNDENKETINIFTFKENNLEIGSG
jgi:hypothetical protein